MAQESKRERERAYEGSCKSRLKTQDGFLNGCRNADESEPEKEEQGDVERKERDGGTEAGTRGGQEGSDVDLAGGRKERTAAASRRGG